MSDFTRCGRPSISLGYDACTRGQGHSGPCAHAWVGDAPAQWTNERCENISPVTNEGRCGLSKGHFESCEFERFISPAATPLNSGDYQHRIDPQSELNQIHRTMVDHLVSGPEIRHPQDRSGQVDGTISDPHHRHGLFPGEIEKSPTLTGTITHPQESYPISWICSRCNLSNNPRNASCVSDTCTRFSFGKQYYVSV